MCSRRSSAKRAFTLVELLIVISILAVLLGLLLPAVSLIRGAAQQARCASNMRQIGLYISLFADANDGMMPGSARTAGSSISWLDILNAEVIAGEGPNVPRLNTQSSRTLCPLFTALPGFRRCYTYNFYAGGGTNDYVAGTSQYGSVVTPASSRGSSYTFYNLGAPMGLFNSKSTKILLRENERAQDYALPAAPTALTLGDDPTFQSFCSHGGTFAFRHRGGHIANFLFLDLHIEARGPDGATLNVTSAYDFN